MTTMGASIFKHAKIDSRDIINLIALHERRVEAGKSTALHKAEYFALKEFESEVKEFTTDTDWENGVTLIRDDCFEDYAKELTADLFKDIDLTRFPFTCIDWEAASFELQEDYITAKFGDITYWYWTGCLMPTPVELKKDKMRFFGDTW
tara:strand:- start:174 stop:620 length:447 start_codon:yes stop_codon:yes gene_type:complete